MAERFRADHGAVDADGFQRWSARCEDGEIVTISVHSSMAGDLPRYLPPFGLTWSTEPAEVSALSLEIPLLDVATASMMPEGRFLAQVWNRLESDLGLFTAEHLVGRVAVHAGVVESGGRVLILPGPSFAGKSTLCRALADAGAVVMSDEYAIIDATTGKVSGWPRPLRIRLDDGGLERVPVGPSTDRPLTVDMVAVLRYVPGEAGELAAMSAGEVVVELMANTVSARLRPEWAFSAASAVATGAVGLSGHRRAAAEAALELLGRLRQLGSGVTSSGSGID